jgi:hypothetical protein
LRQSRNRARKPGSFAVGVRMASRGFLLAAAGALGVGAQYQPNWASLDSRPLPSWYDEAKASRGVEALRHP